MNISGIVLMFLVALTLYSENLDQGEVLYSYEFEMNTNESVVKYLVDTSYYDQFSAEIKGVYIFYKDLPKSIGKDIFEMARILDRYISLKIGENSLDANNKQLQALKEILNINLINKYSEKFSNNTSELRYLNELLRKVKSPNEIELLYDKVNRYISQKEDFYGRQSNKEGVAFCKVIKKDILKPLYELIRNVSDPISKNYGNKSYKRLNKSELKLVWDDFKYNKLGLIEAYFNANNEKLETLDVNNTFQIDQDFIEWNGSPKFYLCLKIFGQNWYFKVDDYYESSLHELKLIQL